MSNTKKRAAEDAAPSQKAKKKKRKGNNIEDESLNTELGVNTLFQRMDNQLLADYLAQRLSRFGTDLSSIEISDISLSGEIQPLLIPDILTDKTCSGMYQRYEFMAAGQDVGQPACLH